ncbi:substrate-binding domain-containing protein [Kineococcus gynurae]|uniref:Substrate-binding domain-containing protein n=1 Tax=Kineococcus gynurae TaxID=452979 RepID=A0ABV5LW41_9ACTN
MPERPARGVVRVGLLLPRQGPAGMFGLSCRAAAELAATEIEVAQGFGGRRVELHDVDAGAAPERVAATVAELLRQNRVDALVGWHLSSVRQAVAPVAAGRVPYVYATAYEGGERHDGVLCSGELPADQVVAALTWLRAEFGLHRWALVGDDYVWPRRTARRARQVLRESGIEVSSEHWVPLGTVTDAALDEVVARIGRAGVDGVVMLLVGSDGVRFNRAFAAAGADAELFRFSPFMDETMLLASGPEATRGLFASAGWFAGLTSASAAEFSRGFAHAFDLVAGAGTLAAAPAPGTMAETTYSALHLLARLGRGRVPTVLDVRAALGGAAWDSPHGTVELHRGRAGHPVHIAVADGVDFDVLARVSGPGTPPRTPPGP